VKAPALVFFLVAATPAMAIEPRAYTCAVSDFLDDSRYPPGAEAIAINRAMAIELLDTGDRIVVMTTRSDSDAESSELPVTKRTADTVVAEIRWDEYSGHSITLEAAQGTETGTLVTGSLIYRTYETDHRWRFACSALEHAGGRVTEPSSSQVART
jgi:hypothetical protein